MNELASIRIFHTGDFHLDSPFSALDVKQSDLRREEHREIFASALQRAVDEGCKIILISGDLFDCGYVSTETVNTVFGAIERCPIPVVLSPGNHDPFTEGGIYAKKSLPKNLFVFKSEELSYFDFDELSVRVFGYAFTSNRYPRNPLDHPYELKEGYLNILCAHSELDEPIPRFAPINRAQLENSGFDYVALGHVHLHDQPQKVGSTTYCYAGFAVGRSFDELGFGRALLVDIERDSSKVTVSPVTLSDKRYAIEKLDVSGSEQFSDVTEKIASLVSSLGYGKETYLRIILGGVVSPKLVISSVDPERFGLSLLQLLDNTLPLLDSDYLQSDISLKGALYRELLPKLRSENERERKIASEALLIGLSALEGKSFM